MKNKNQFLGWIPLILVCLVLVLFLYFTLPKINYKTWSRFGNYIIGFLLFWITYKFSYESAIKTKMDLDNFKSRMYYILGLSIIAIFPSFLLAEFLEKTDEIKYEISFLYWILICYTIFIAVNNVRKKRSSIAWRLKDIYERYQIIINSEKISGTAFIRDTDIPVSQVVGELLYCQDFKKVLSVFPALTHEDIKRVLYYAMDTSKYSLAEMAYLKDEEEKESKKE